ncbi:hypothetical protein LJR153_002170 [Paenibacillus sp. LjRoot153]|uniref:ketopantoate reductase family protein n=1 Tax=Paenibacillus sp. LjRoot153 TaxID=3342270 RepID=UPI003ECF5D4B
MTTVVNKPKILIIGAGAVGYSVGYHLHLSNTEITFLVRKGRKSTFDSPQKLYCYDDATLKDFHGYNVIEDVEKVKPQIYQFIIITQDGSASRMPEGIDLLTKLGNIVRGSETIVIMCAF